MSGSLFITCYIDTLFPETGRAIVALLERPGVDLDFHSCQTCCGQMSAASGLRAEALSQTKRYVRLFQDAETVAIASSSWLAMIRDRYPTRLKKPGTKKQGIGTGNRGRSCTA